MGEIVRMLTGALGPMGPLLVLAGVGLLLVLLVLPALLRQREDPLDKLRAGTAAEAKKEAKREKEQQLRTGGGSDKLDRFAGFLEPKSQEEMSEARKWMQRAGYRSPTAVRTFHAVQFGAALAMLACGAGYVLYHSATSQAPLDTTMMLVAILLPAVVGYYGPMRWVNSRVAARRQQIQDGFPDALDMLLVCVEAGQSLDQAINRVSVELVTSYPVLAEELATVAREIKAGLDKPTVLRSFGERSDVPDVMSFVTVMIQSQQFGTSIAEALRLYASDMRDKRVMRAEEAANKIPTKMTLGTMLFTVPPLLIILVGPSIHDMIANFKQMGM